jgi:iron complex outermembrane recepter protein
MKLAARNLMLAGVAVSSILTSVPAFSQTAQTAEEQNGEGLSDIVVTAQRRSENLQNVPISISAVTGETLAAQGITRSQDIVTVVPNLNVTAVFGPVEPIITIRGVGLNDLNNNNNSAAGVYVDDVYLFSPSQLAFSLFDLERVEVLKGPQGTLYGRNTTAGAIRYITTAPSEEFEGYAQLSYGSYNSLRAEGAVGGSLADGLSARLAFSYERSDGYVQNRAIDARVNTTNVAAARLSLRYNPNNDVDVTLRVSGGYNRSDLAGIFQYGGLNDPASLTAPTGPVRCAAALAGRYDPATCTGFLGYTDTDGDPFAGDYNFVRNIDNRFWAVSLNSQFQLGSVTLNSVTSFDRFIRDQPTDSDASPQSVLETTRAGPLQTFSQELRLSGELGSNVDWIVGGYFLDNNFSANNDFDVFRSARPITASLGAPQGFDPFRIFGGLPSFFVLSTIDQETSAWAAFAHAKVKLSDRLQLTAGIRYSREKKTFDYQTIFAGEAPATYAAYRATLAGIGLPPLISPEGLFIDFQDEFRSGGVSGDISLDYKVTDDVLVYGRFARGFKSGGFNGGVAFDRIVLEPFGDERLDAYEVGFKSELFGRTLRLNASAFLYDYKDLQVFTIVNNGSGVPTQVLDNAAQARIWGIDGEMLYQPNDRFSARLSAGYLSTELRDFVSPATGRDLSGARLANAPEFTLSGSLRYTAPIAPWGSLTGLVDFTHTGFRFFDTNNNPLTSGDGYWVFNSRLSLDIDNSRTQVSVFARNIFNKQYVTNIFDLSDFGYNVLNFGQPRTLGIEISTRF